MNKNLQSIAPTYPNIDEKAQYYQNRISQEGFGSFDVTKLPPAVNARRNSWNNQERDVYEALCRNEYQLVSKIHNV